MSYFKMWLRRQVRYFISTLLPVLLIIIFGMLAVSFWPAHAWGSTAIFAGIVLLVTFWLV